MTNLKPGDIVRDTGLDDIARRYPVGRVIDTPEGIKVKWFRYYLDSSDSIETNTRDTDGTWVLENRPPRDRATIIAEIQQLLKELQ